MLQLSTVVDMDCTRNDGEALSNIPVLLPLYINTYHDIQNVWTTLLMIVKH